MRSKDMQENLPDWQHGELKVVLNDEGQYSIWPLERATPAGWREVGKTGDKAACLEFIRETWVNQQPLSVQRSLAGSGGAVASV